jgi:hypothetical protein
MRSLLVNNIGVEPGARAARHQYRRGTEMNKPKETPIVFAASILRANFWGTHATVLAISHGNGSGHWAIDRAGKRVYNSGTTSLKLAIQRAEVRAN